MELGRRVSLLSCFLLAVMVSQNFLIAPVVSRSLDELDDQKHFLHFPKHVKPGGDCPTPSHGGGNSPIKPTPPPSHGGGGGSPVKPTPTPPPTPSHGGGSTPPSPSKPKPPHGGGGGGGYYNSPPPPIIVPPSAPVTPIPPTPPGPHVPPSFPGTCDYWRTHPGAILDILGYLGSISQSFGAACSGAFGQNLSLPDALKNTRADGIGALYREGTAALLNSVATDVFPYNSQQVKDAFVAAIVSDEAASSQARLFKLANEGKTKL